MTGDCSYRDIIVQHKMEKKITLLFATQNVPRKL